jgi:hypothetical protein
MVFSVGDPIRCFYNDSGTGEYVGCTGKITDVDGRAEYPYGVSFCDEYFGEHELEHYPQEVSTATTFEKAIENFPSIVPPPREEFDTIEKYKNPRYKSGWERAEARILPYGYDNTSGKHFY